MKKLLSFTALGLMLAAVSLHAATGFVNKSATAGPGSATNSVGIPGLAGKQFVVHNITYRNATNVGVIEMTTGTTAFAVTATNILGSTATTNHVNSTNGFIPGGFVALDRGGVVYVAALSSLLGTTNIILASGGFGATAQVYDNVYMLDTATTLPLNVAPFTNAINGSAVFVGNAGRPVVIRMGPAGLTNNLQVTGSYQ